MPNVKFSLPDDDYLTPRDSMLFLSETDKNSVGNPICGNCASPSPASTAPSSIDFMRRWVS